MLISRDDGTGSHKDHVAIRRASRRELAADVSPCTGTIIDDDLLTPDFTQLLRDDARNDVRRTARRKRHDDAHGFGRITLCPCQRCQGHGRTQGESLAGAHYFSVIVMAGKAGVVYMLAQRTRHMHT